MALVITLMHLPPHYCYLLPRLGTSLPNSSPCNEHAMSSWHADCSTHLEQAPIRVGCAAAAARAQHIHLAYADVPKVAAGGGLPAGINQACREGRSSKREITSI